jgi:hypothetical protein
MPIGEEPKMPHAVFMSGIQPVLWDLQRIILKAMIEKGVIDRDELCALLLASHDEHQKTVDETGAAGNANAAAVLRLLMMQLGCTDIPDHQ